MIQTLRSPAALVAVGALLVVGSAFSGRVILDANATKPTCLPNEFADGQEWVCTFDDEFAGSTLDRTRWFVKTGFVTGNPKSEHYACTVDDRRFISVSHGALHLTMDRVAEPIKCPGYPPTHYEAPTVSTYHTFSQQYGRIEVRSRVAATTAPGLQESVWLWPDDRYVSAANRTKGEIDIAEQYSNYPQIAVPFLHADSKGDPVPGVNTAWTCAAPRGEWNTYVFVSTPTSIRIDINGTTCLTNTDPGPVFRKRYILMLTQALGIGTDAPTPGTTLPTTMDIDYVRVWKPA